MKFLQFIFQDWTSNKGNIKARIILVFFRLCHLLSTRNKIIFVLAIPILILYRIIVEWMLCVEIPFRTKIGSCLRLYHGQALVINNQAIIGNNCTLRHSTTIGNNKEVRDGGNSGCPIIGNNVDIGCNSVIIGPITIGNNVVIGAGSVVVKDIKSSSKVVGNPARIIGATIV